MAKIVELPDGSEAEFPDTMDDSAIKDVLRKKFPSPSTQKTMKQEMAAQSAASPVDAFNTGIANAATRVAAGVGRLLPQALAKHLPTQADVDLLEAGSEGSVPARAGQIGMDLAATAPLAGGKILSQAAKMAGYGGLTANEGEAIKGAAIGAGATAAVPVLGAVLRSAGRGVANVLGATTGAGREATKQAFKDAPGFVENMRGKVPQSDVVDSAREGVRNLRTQMHDNYATAKGGWAGDTTPLSFDPINKVAQDAADKFSFKGVLQPGVEDVQRQVQNILGTWQQNAAQDASFATVEGLDALKRHLQDVTPENVANRTGRSYVTEVVNGVKNAIIAQAPKYRAAMQDYWKRSGELDEITRSLSLGDRSTVDASLRRLQTLTSPHAGRRLASAQTLEQAGSDILPQVAGQALSGWVPQGGLRGVAGGLAALSNPAAIPVFSPRMSGEFLRAAGNTYRHPATEATIAALRKLSPAVARVTSQSEDQ